MATQPVLALGRLLGRPMATLFPLPVSRALRSPGRAPAEAALSSSATGSPPSPTRPRRLGGPHQPGRGAASFAGPSGPAGIDSDDAADRARMRSVVADAAGVVSGVVGAVFFFSVTLPVFFCSLESWSLESSPATHPARAGPSAFTRVLPPHIFRPLPVTPHQLYSSFFENRAAFEAEVCTDALTAFQARLGHDFEHPFLLRAALTHSSFRAETTPCEWWMEWVLGAGVGWLARPAAGHCLA
jgi:hypothetical protein